MQYTLRNVPDDLDRALRERARRENKSLNEVALEALSLAFGLTGERPAQRDLSDIAGTWREDDQTAEALRDQRRVHRTLWR